MNAHLARLAALHGIEPEFQNARGEPQHASDTALIAVLDAMGVDARDDARIDAAIESIEAARWRQVLAPVNVVVTTDPEPRIRLNLPAALQSATLGWRLGEENGAQHAGSFAAADLAVTADASVLGQRYLSCELRLPLLPPPGYHRLEIHHGADPLGSSTLISVPPTCYRSPVLEGDGKVWGAAVRLYGVRSARNWGIGDYTDLKGIVEQLGQRGAAIVGVNPLHALFPHDPGQANPYRPSSRLFKNLLYLDVEAIEDFRECDAARSLVRSASFQSRLKALRDAELVDYAGVAAAKYEVLETLFAHFRDHHLHGDGARARSLRAFRAAQGLALHRQALFETLQERLHRDDPRIHGWPMWPQAYQDPVSPECERFAAEHADRVDFFAYLHWQADQQLDAAGKRSFELGLGVGLCEDLAVSVHGAGADVWAARDLYARNANIGTPADDIGATHQAIPLPPFVPERLRAAGYVPFIAALRANMRHCGALRIGRAMGLLRLFWMPAGDASTGGAYVAYPLDELLGILALESHRNRCCVIGDDIEAMPEEIRARLRAAGIFSYRVLHSERHATGEFKAPSGYPPQAFVAVSGHDMPTLAGWWAGSDIQARTELGLFPSPRVRDTQVVARAQDRAQLLLALEREDLLPSGATVNPISVPEMTAALARAITVFLARSNAQMLGIQMEDVLGVREQAHLPGAAARHPNWQRKLPLALERWPDDERLVQLVNALTALRGRARPQTSRRTAAVAAIIPRATYRLQLHRDFTFDNATAIVPYLARLGVSHVYCSPYLRARPGSRHGYDITDHNMLNPEIGNRDDFERFVAALKEHSLGQIIDMVPNHMGVMGSDNSWWMDVLENGPASTYADFFDIDWQPNDASLAGKVLVPILGDHYGNVLERGEITLAYEPQAGGFAAWYYEHRFPIAPREYPRLLTRACAFLDSSTLPAEGSAAFESLISAFGHLPPRDAKGSDALAERNRDKELHKSRLARLVNAHPALAEAIERAVRTINGVVGERASFDQLDQLLEAQAYRLAYWRVAGDEINYRRFFDINDLAALRMENDTVFEATHRFVLELAAQGKIDGLRIDHPDGLFQPAEYFRRLQARYAHLAGDTETAHNSDARRLYVLLEKIAAPHEHLPLDWAVHGTTGYRFANVVNGLFVDTAAKSRVDRVWRTFVGDEAVALEDAVYRGKRQIMASGLAGELTVLANRLTRIARAERRTRDYTFNSLRQTLAEVAARFPVYRTYIDERVSKQDRRFVNWAVTQAKARSATADASVFDFVKDVLLARAPEGASEELQAEYRRFALRFQQFSAPVMAKGLEDTSFYVFNRLASLNDVGGDPNCFGMSVSAFHGASADRRAKWPHTMLATSTHDSKRSEDVRARIDVISEIPAAWRLAVRRWSRANRGKKRTVAGNPAPSRNDEYLLYQTLAGTFPADDVDADALAIYRERIERYLLKAVREAKLHSSWINPNEAYESATASFVNDLLGRLDGNYFLDDFRIQARTFAWFGALNSLSLTLVKLTSPGVPDIYQGMEFVELSLVDPDNRRAVDFTARRDALAALATLADDDVGNLAARVGDLLRAPHDGRAKLWITWRALGLRAQRPQLFQDGDYHPITTAGAAARHVVGYARRLGSTGVVVLAGRLFASLGLDVGVAPLAEAAWADTSADLSFIPTGTRLENVLTGETLSATGGHIRLATVFTRLPLALLVIEGSAA